LEVANIFSFFFSAKRKYIYIFVACLASKTLEEQKKNIFFFSSPLNKKKFFECKFITFLI
jgi:hypothetical protein